MKRYIGLFAAGAMLLAMASSCSAEETPPAASDWHSGIKTDWSQLTPYEPPEDIYSRLSEAPLSELVPSPDYGPLLPYIGERLYCYNEGSLFGFVTADGAIVTDAVYPLISLWEGGEKPVYRLIKYPGRDMGSGWERADTYGVCADDGSWVTACVYRGVICLDSVIILVRDRKTNDADVIDYSGKPLYTLRDQDYFSQLLPELLAEFFYSFGDGLVTFPLSDGSTMILDQRTGACVDTGFAYVGPFSEGLAPATDKRDGTGLYGYVDRSFSVVIAPRYDEPGDFWGGRAVVRDVSGAYLIIDKTGAALFRSKGLIKRYAVGLFHAADESGGRWLDGNLNELSFRPGFSGELTAQDGWYCYACDGQTILSDDGREYVLPGAVRVSSVTGGYVVYRSMDGGDGVMRLDGTEVVKAGDQYTSIRAVTVKNGGIFFTFSHSVDTSRQYKLLNGEGAAVLEGRGRITYDARTGLFQVADDEFFGYCDETGRFVFRLSLMEWLPD